MANQYFTCVLDAWRDGTTLYGRMHYYRTSGTYYYQDTSFPNPTMNLGGTTYEDSTLGNLVRGGVYVGDIYGGTFSRTVAGTGTRTVTYTAGSGQRSDFQGTWSVDVGGFPGAYTAPNTPTLSTSVASDTQINITYGTTSFGNPSSGTVYLYGGTAASPTAQIASKTTTGNSTYNYTGLTNNTKYYFRSRAKNSQLWSNYSSDKTAVTLPAALGAMTASATGDTTIKVDYTTAAGGTEYTKNIQYSLDNSTWTTGATVSAGTATTGSFNITGLTPETTYTVYVRVNTTAGNSSASTANVTTPISYKLYGSVNGKTKRIRKLYCSVNGKTKLVNKLYGSVNGKTKRIF